MAKKYEGRAQFLIVYIKEAHPADDWASTVHKRLAYIKDPTSFHERTLVANTCMGDLQIDIPCVIDDMDNSTARAYKGWPDRLFVVGVDGRLAYAGGPGPVGFRPDEMEAALKTELQRR